MERQPLFSSRVSGFILTVFPEFACMNAYVHRFSALTWPEPWFSLPSKQIPEEPYLKPWSKIRS